MAAEETKRTSRSPITRERWSSAIAACRPAEPVSHFHFPSNTRLAHEARLISDNRFTNPCDLPISDRFPHGDKFLFVRLNVCKGDFADLCYIKRKSRAKHTRDEVFISGVVSSVCLIAQRMLLAEVFGFANVERELAIVRMVKNIQAEALPQRMKLENETGTGLNATKLSRIPISGAEL